MNRHFLRLFLLIAFALITSICADFKLSAAAETLYLKGGDQLSGTSHGFRDGNMRWQLPQGLELLIPLEQIERIEFGQQLGETKGLPESTEEPIVPAVDTASASPAEGAATDGQPNSAVVAAGGESGPSTGATEELTYFERFTESIEDILDEGHTFLDPWTKRLEFGGKFIEGNTNSNAYETLVNIERSQNRKLIQLEAGGQYAKSYRVLVSNRWYGNVTADFDQTGNWILFIASKNEMDEFENLDYRAANSGGLGYRFFNEGTKRLIFRLGPGLTYEKFHDPNRTRTVPDLFGEMEIKWPVSPRAVIEHKMTMNPSLDNSSGFRLLGVSGLLLHLDEDAHWSLKFGFRQEYNRKPNPGRLPSDYTSSILLVYTRQ